MEQRDLPRYGHPRWDLELPPWMAQLERRRQISEYNCMVLEAHRQSSREERKEILTAAAMLCGFLVGLVIVCGIVL